LIPKRYPDAIVTGLTAYYIHGLTDVVPDVIDVATKRGGAKIQSPQIKQQFISQDWIAIGKSIAVHDGVELTIYDQERMLLELMRERNKLPYDLYKEVVSSYRRRAENLDIYKLQDYAEAMPRGKKYLAIILKEVY